MRLNMILKDMDIMEFRVIHARMNPSGTGIEF
jgi:hypothetical protein